MYIPKAFEETDESKLIAFIRENPFGILFSADDSSLDASHLVFHPEKDESGRLFLYGHFAKVNDHWKKIRDRVLVVFSGAHCYVSPTWSGEPHTVPTWNYAAVHVTGNLSLLDEADSQKRIGQLVASYETNVSSDWKLDFDDSYFRNLVQNGIAAFQIEVTKLEGKFKLSQNKSVEIQSRVASQLEAMTDDNSRTIAKWMRENLDRKKSE
ncbi:FMN-binding negative transcriptional regulator [Leptospira yasudae]|uniref:FMN-binding negative transcriptional regulator n=1 Tax=Leptospira yasudae TaxID=2202201 RepID=UPI000E59DDF2|nr:FMN-binding negative transcriptional regulator [Leptospira yasudae]RHX96129.1 FMN-binding negative transcriptional regulator [Leptospira yasudae]TGK29946.1 FMN-binding negative transcriptional regulator [Leptospira yasudae]TGM07428.1 FMN-binding negative transcriptional regulator [Leptospira yasudae]